MPPQTVPIPLARLDFVDRPPKRVYRRMLEENSGFPGDDGVEDAARAERDDRRAQGHRLEGGDHEVFDPREDQAARATDDRHDSGSLYGSQKLNVGRRVRP